MWWQIWECKKFFFFSCAVVFQFYYSDVPAISCAFDRAQPTVPVSPFGWFLLLAPALLMAIWFRMSQRMADLLLSLSFTAPQSRRWLNKQCCCSCTAFPDSGVSKLPFISLANRWKIIGAFSFVFAFCMHAQAHSFFQFTHPHSSLELRGCTVVALPKLSRAAVPQNRRSTAAPESDS